jgi:hypothetical protein
MLAEINRFAYAIWSFLFYINPNDSARMNAWRDQDLADMRNTPGIELDAVGKLIGVGMQHRIYEYDADMPMVLKVATPIPLLRFPTFADAQADVQFVVSFFAPYVVEPIQVLPLRRARYVIKQRRLGVLRPITPNELNNEIMSSQFLDIAQRNRRMIRDAGRSLDFLGREGQRKCRAALLGFSATPTIANIVIEPSGDGAEQLRILDTDLENFHLNARTLRDRQSALAARMAVQINRLLIRHFFKIDIAAQVF